MLAVSLGELSILQTNDLALPAILSYRATALAIGQYSHDPVW